MSVISYEEANSKVFSIAFPTRSIIGKLYVDIGWNMPFNKVDTIYLQEFNIRFSDIHITNDEEYDVIYDMLYLPYITQLNTDFPDFPDDSKYYKSGGEIRIIPNRLDLIGHTFDLRIFCTTDGWKYTTINHNLGG